MDVRGFWLGFIFALTCQDIIVGLIICRADWSPNDGTKANEVGLEVDDDGFKKLKDDGDAEKLNPSGTAQTLQTQEADYNGGYYNPETS